MGKRVAAVLCSFVTGAVVLTGPSDAVGAADSTGSVDLITAYPSTNYGFVGDFSDDLSTLALLVRGDETPAGTKSGDLVIVDIETDRRRVLPLPETIASDYTLVGLNTDGSTLLIAADWEGIEAGDEDGGFFDAFLVDTATGDVELLTAGLDDVSINALDLDSAGDTVLLGVYPATTFGEGSLMIWDQGTITDVTLPVNPLGDFSGTGLTLLSGDGESLLYGTRSGFQSAWRLRELSSGDETVVAAPDAGGADVSDDGRTVISGGWRDDGQSELYVWDTSTTRVRRSIVPFQVPRFLSADGSTIAGVSNNYDGGDDASTALWVHEVVSGESEQVLTSSNVNYGFNVVAVDQTGQRLAFVTGQLLDREGPITLDELFGSGEISDHLYLFDRNGTTVVASTPGYSGTLDDQMVRLYGAYFDRDPDAGGLEFWRGQRAGGRSLDSVSGEFARSSEFLAAYGELADEDFVDLVYQNVLDRTPDAGGRAFWLDQLANGRTRGSLMTLFSESPEFIDVTDTLTPENASAAAVRRLFASFFVRNPDPAGLAYWVGEAESGVPLATISERFYLSDEFQSFYSDLQDDPFTLMRVAYRNTFDREADVEGYVLAEQVATGQISVPEMLLQIANLPEFVAATSTTPIDG